MDRADAPDGVATAVATESNNDNISVGGPLEATEATTSQQGRTGQRKRWHKL